MVLSIPDVQDQNIHLDFDMVCEYLHIKNDFKANEFYE